MQYIFGDRMTWPAGKYQHVSDVCINFNNESFCYIIYNFVIYFLFFHDKNTVIHDVTLITDTESVTANLYHLFYI